jgi:hypothetical protein
VEALARAVARADIASLDEAVALIRPFLIQIGWLDALIEAECKAMAGDPRYLPSLRTSRSGSVRHLVLARTERIWMAVTIVEAPTGQAPTGQAPTGRAEAERVHFSGRYCLCRPLGRHPLRGVGFALEGGRAVMTGEQTHPPGRLLEMDERRETMRIHPGAQPIMLLRAQVAPQGPVAASLFDAATGAPVATANMDESHARSLMLLSLLRLQGRTDAADHFEAALDAPLPHQRWAVMREFLALDTMRALPALRAMTGEDENAEIRRLAARTLERIEPCPA